MSSVQSIRRAFDVLVTLGDGPLGVTEVADRAGLPKSTAARLLATLVGEGAVEQVPGDTQRNLSTEQEYAAQTFKHVLAPLWLLTYVYRGKPYQVLVNGSTGKIAGEHPWSWVKIFFATLAVLIAAIIVISVAGSN